MRSPHCGQYRTCVDISHGARTCPTSHPFPLIYLTSKSNPEFALPPRLSPSSRVQTDVRGPILSVFGVLFSLGSIGRLYLKVKSHVITVNSELN